MEGHNCSQLCVELEGSFNCSCYSGYKLQEDGVTCEGNGIARAEHWRFFLNLHKYYHINTYNYLKNVNFMNVTNLACLIYYFQESLLHQGLKNFVYIFYAYTYGNTHDMTQDITHYL